MTELQARHLYTFEDTHVGARRLGGKPMHGGDIRSPVLFLAEYDLNAPVLLTAFGIIRAVGFGIWNSRFGRPVAARGKFRRAHGFAVHQPFLHRGGASLGKLLVVIRPALDRKSVV